MAIVNPSLMWFPVVVFLLVTSSQSGQSARSPGERECNQIGNILRNKSLTYPWWDPATLTSGSSSSGCPARGKSLKCCPSTFDTPTHRRDIGNSFTQKWLGSKLTAAKEVFSDRRKRFDVTFKALLQRAHASFHSMFERTYGMLYIQHADVFRALFKTLEKYYDDGKEHLESKLNEFFAILTRKMFEVLNAQYDFTEAYLSCATIVISEKQGNDLHRQIVSSLRRSFVATRAFAQGLLEAERVISNVNKIQLNTTDCLIPIAKMVTCPICAENRAYKPCLPLCTSITVKCLSPTFHLAKPWNEFARALEDLTDRLMGPYNVEAVVEPIHIKISEAIMNFQESGGDLSQAVFSKCGKPTLKSRGFKKREALAEPRVQASSDRRTQEKEDPHNKSLEKILRDTKNRVRKGKDLWHVLPRQVCNAISKDYSSQLCWNGTSTLKMGNEKNNPKGKDDSDEGTSLTLDTQPQGRPIPFIYEQIQILQLITDKLKTAFNGGDIQWIQEIDSDDEMGSGMGMGSGSGEIPTDLEDTDDDDPGGDVPKGNHRQPTVSTDLNSATRKTPPMPERPFHPHAPDFEESTRPSIFNKPIIPNVRDDEEEEEEDEDEEEDDDETSNLNINTHSNNNRPLSPGGGESIGTDFGIDFPPTVSSNPPRFPSFPMVPPTAPTTTTTTTRPTTSRTTTTTWRPLMTVKPRKDPHPLPAPNPPVFVVKPDNPGAKTVAVVNVFTPVIMSMLQKLFNIN